MLNFKKPSQLKSAKPKVFCKNTLPLLEGSITMIVSQGGTGKALKNGTGVLTPSGFMPIELLKTGDKVIGSNGKSTNILGVYPQGEREIYKVKFIDNTYTLCDGDHLWSFYDGSDNKYRHDLKTKTTLELLNGRFSRKKFDKRYGTTQVEYFYSIPVPKQCEFGTIPEIAIDPYMFGLLLGDGGFSSKCSITFTNANPKIVSKFINRLPYGDQVLIRYRSNSYHVRVKSKSGKKRSLLRQAIDRMKLGGHLSINKFIPKQFKYADLQTRQELYDGLVDTDGYVINGWLQEYSTSSKQLAEDFLFLGRSLGKILTIKERDPKYTYKGKKLTGHHSYRIYEKKGDKKTIISITKERIANATCISVDAKDNLYVIDGFNLTHNSMVSLKLAIDYVKETNKKVALWLTEDSEGETFSRYRNLVAKEKDPAFFNDNISFIATPPVRLTKMHDGNAILSDQYEQLLHDLDPYGMIVLDPLLQFNGCDENSNSHAGVMMGALKTWVAQKDKILLILHHVTFTSDGSIKARGAGEWQNGCRCVYSVAYPASMIDGQLVPDRSSDNRIFELIKDNGIGYRYFTNDAGEKERILRVFPEEAEDNTLPF